MMLKLSAFETWIAVFARRLSLVLVAILVGCYASRPAPVIDRTPATVKSLPKAKPVAKQADWRPEFYIVKKGDTLYNIALDHGLDYRDLVEWNAIENPNVIRVGQQLRLAMKNGARSSAIDVNDAGVVTAPLATVAEIEGKPVVNPTPGVSRSEPRAATQSALTKTQPTAMLLPYSEQALAELQRLKGTPSKAEVQIAKAHKSEVKVDDSIAPTTADEERVEWVWPTAGKIVSGFNDNAKGLDIAGKTGQFVFASAPGKVVYSGSGLRGYGKLIIIKHNKTFLSAYAHNSEILVKEGQNVAQGQKIAHMGDSDSDQVKLHFEIRRLGKPVDPLKYLPQDGQS